MALNHERRNRGQGKHWGVPVAKLSELLNSGVGHRNGVSGRPSSGGLSARHLRQVILQEVLCFRGMSSGALVWPRGFSLLRATTLQKHKALKSHRQPPNKKSGRRVRLASALVFNISAFSPFPKLLMVS